MPEIIIDGVIGWDVYPRSIRRQLNDAEGKEVNIQLASPGGFVYDGLEIFNLIRDYNEKQSKVNITIKGLAASMASYISLAVPKSQRFAEDNAVFMIHNVWGFSIGDYREMNKTGKEFESLTNLLAKGYSDQSGKSLSEIRQLMDDETWYYGDEIEQAGFVSSIIKHDENENEYNYTKDEKLSLAKTRLNRMFFEMQKNQTEIKQDLSKAAALITKAQIKQIKIPASAGKNKTEGNKMTLDEFKKNHPELYAQVLQEGKDKESDRVKAHITMGRQCGNIELAAKNIEEGKEFNHTITAEYMAEGMKNTVIQNRKDDDPGSTETKTEGGDDKKDTEEYKAKLLARRGIK